MRKGPNLRLIVNNEFNPDPYGAKRSMERVKTAALVGYQIVVTIAIRWGMWFPLLLVYLADGQITNAAIKQNVAIAIMGLAALAFGPALKLLFYSADSWALAISLALLLHYGIGLYNIYELYIGGELYRLPKTRS